MTDGVKNSIMFFAGLALVIIMVATTIYIIKKIVQIMVMAMTVCIICLAVISGGKYIIKQAPSVIHTASQRVETVVSDITNNITHDEAYKNIMDFVK